MKRRSTYILLWGTSIIHILFYDQKSYQNFDPFTHNTINLAIAVMSNILKNTQSWNHIHHLSIQSIFSLKNWSTFILSAAFCVGKGYLHMSLLSFRFCQFSCFYFITCHIILNNVFLKKYFIENTYTETHPCYNRVFHVL